MLAHKQEICIVIGKGIFLWGGGGGGLVTVFSI